MVERNAGQRLGGGFRLRSTLIGQGHLGKISDLRIKIIHVPVPQKVEASPASILSVHRAFLVVFSGHQKAGRLPRGSGTYTLGCARGACKRKFCKAAIGVSLREKKTVQGREVLTISFVVLSALYGAGFYASTQVNADAAWSRFETLNDAGYEGRASVHGDKAFALWSEAGEGETFLHDRRLELADAHFGAEQRPSAIELYKAALQSPEAARLTDERRVQIRRRLAEMHLAEGNAIAAALIAAQFLDRAGDATSHFHPDALDPVSRDFVRIVDSFKAGFTDVLPPDAADVATLRSAADPLEAATATTKLGGYYALADDGAYAAAGLLSVAHGLRLAELGPDHEDTVHAALLLASVYERIDRLSDAAELYDQVFRAQERVKGANNPELSLYIRLLVGVYEKQGRFTQAEALNRQMRQIFRDAYGARRYAANQARDRLYDVNRPVSAAFPLDSAYVPPDLVPASAYDIPLSKPPYLEEMQFREAKIDGTSLPEQLAKLIEACSVDGERLSLRSGYRSHRIQEILHQNNGDKGTVAHPGTSEHQLGLAVDIDVNRRFMRATDRSYSCFEKRAWQFGFILTFPVGNTYLEAYDSFEPWHWRFVGPQTSLLYREIGPWGKPQEFLAALPCYEERALSGLFVDRERGDVCLEMVTAAVDDERDT